MKRIGVYVHGHDALRAAMRSGFPTIGAHYCERSLVDHTRGQVEKFDLVLVVAPARNADVVIADYKARGTPVLMVDSSDVTDAAIAAPEFVANSLGEIKSRLYGTPAPEPQPQRSESDDVRQGQEEAMQAEREEADAQEEAVSAPRPSRRRRH